MATGFARLMVNDLELMVCVIDIILSVLTVRFQQLYQWRAPKKGILRPGTSIGCTHVVSALGFGKYAERENTGRDPSGAQMEIQYFNHIF